MHPPKANTPANGADQSHPESDEIPIHNLSDYARECVQADSTASGVELWTTPRPWCRKTRGWGHAPRNPTARANVQLDSPMTVLLRKEMDFEVAFVRAGGLLLAGPDPTGNGGVLPGFGDQREIELLVEAGLTPVEAIHVATENGAFYLGQQDRIGTLSPGKQADLIVIKGDPSKSIDEIENVDTVFKAGIGYDPKKLIDSVRGQVGIR